MATGTFYLRPSADISLGHPVYPETLTAGYLAINEEVADGTATYIGYKGVIGGKDIENGASSASTFELTLTEEARITRVVSAKFGYVGTLNEGNTTSSSKEECPSCSCAVFVLGNKVFDGEHTAIVNSEGSEQQKNGLENADMPNLVTAFNNAISHGNTFPSVTVEVVNKLSEVLNTKLSTDSYVTQLYVALECEYTSGLPIHTKQNDTWLQPQKAYQKQSGTWVEITEDECKTILQSKFILHGGS